VSDSGLQHLAGLKRLKSLYLWQTDVTTERARAFAATLPGLAINLGHTHNDSNDTN
jgi:hypothetical protein